VEKTFFEGNTWRSLIIRNKIVDELLNCFLQRKLSHASFSDQYE